MVEIKMLLALCLIFFATHLTSSRDVKDYNLEQLVELFQNLMMIRPTDVLVTNRDVTFYLYARNISNIQISENDELEAKDTKFIIHGYLDNHNRSWCQHMALEYLKKDDFNVIIVDWGRIAQTFYLSSAFNSKEIGEKIAKFIMQQDLSYDKIHLIGHSLGAHIAGSAAQIIKNNTGSKIARITALDPAGPAFRNMLMTGNKLDKNDAEIVDVIHTDGGGFGTYKQMGTFDIYLNGGVRVQPDCRFAMVNFSSPGELFEHSYCSHTRSYVHFTELINDVKYTCKKCENVIKFFSGLCNLNGYYTFGAEDITKAMSGVCFINTTLGKK